MKYRLSSIGIIAGCAFFWTSQVRSNEPGEAQIRTADPMQGKSPGDVRNDNGLKMSLVWCPPGAVVMENVDVILITERPAKKALLPAEIDDDAEPQPEPAAKVRLEFVFEPQEATKVTRVKAFLSRGYWLGKYEVTQAEWTEVMQTEPWSGKEDTKAGIDFPATYVDWNDAMEFCRRLTQREREAGRLPDRWEYTLPTEAQWERACRARTETRFSFGDDDSQIGEYAWTIENTVIKEERYAHRVGQKKPNAWGLCDMHGNVWEWCRDVYAEKLPGGRDPEVAGNGANRVLRGGGIYRHAPDCRSSYRNYHKPEWRLYDLGFRVVLTRTK